MASFNKKFSFFLLLITFQSLLHTHARESLFFNKISSAQEQQPDFLPDHGNAYGLYGHESSQLPSSTTTTTPYNTEFKLPQNMKHLPKNYNPVYYVTEPEVEDDINASETFTQEKSYNRNPKYYNYNNINQQDQKDDIQESYEGRNENNYYKGMSETRFRPGSDAATANTRAQPQGLSDTRFMGNGKYFYDVNGETNGYDSVNGGGYKP